MKDMTNYPNVIDMSAIVMAKEAEKKKEIFDGDTDFGNLENVDEPQTWRGRNANFNFRMNHTTP